MSDVAASVIPSAVLISTTLLSFLSGFGLGVYAIRGYIVPPNLADQRRRNLTDPVESDESDVEEDTLLDHAPNWTNSEDADRRQGLRASPANANGKQEAVGEANEAEQGVSDGTATPDAQLVDLEEEECKLVLVVRTDLGMTKGVYTPTLSSSNRHDLPRVPTVVLHSRPFFYLANLSIPSAREDCRAVRPRYARLLQDPPAGVATEPAGRRSTLALAVGTLRPGQDRGAGKGTRGTQCAAEEGTRPGRHGRVGRRRWAHTNRGWQLDRAGRRACAPQRGGQGYRASQVALEGIQAKRS